LATRNLFQNLTRSAAPVPPMEFILSLRRAYPQFGQTSRWAFVDNADQAGWCGAWRLSAGRGALGHILHTPTCHACPALATCPALPLLQGGLLHAAGR
jgi:hypothetical protein